MIKKYLKTNYLYKGRWLSYWYQIQESIALKKINSILEIGPGNKIVSETLQKMGYRIKTMDLNPLLSPDFVADIRKSQGLPQECFDLVLCCQVLEHFPYRDFKIALKNIGGLTKRYAIISLPYTSLGTLRLSLPFYKTRGKTKLFTPFPRKHKKKGGHYWEIGKRGYHLKRIKKDFQQSPFKIIKDYPIPENPYHYMFICRKKK